MGKQATPRAAKKTRSEPTPAKANVVKVKRVSARVQSSTDADPKQANALMRAFAKAVMKKGEDGWPAHFWPKKLQQHATYKAIADAPMPLQMLLFDSAVESMTLRLGKQETEPYRLLLSLLMRRKLPLPRQTVIALLDLALLRDANLPASTLVGFLERWAAENDCDREVVQRLRKLHDSLSSTYDRKVQARLKELIHSLCDPAPENPGQPAVGRLPSRLEDLLLRREGVQCEGRFRLVDRLAAAMVQPAVGDDQSATSFGADAAPRHAEVIAAINEVLASANDRMETKHRRALPAAIATSGWAGAAVLAGCIAAMTLHPIRFDFDSPRAYRFHDGAEAMINALSELLGSIRQQEAEPESFGEFCSALSRFRDLEYIYFQWAELSDLIHAAAAAIVDRADEAVLLMLLRYRERLARTTDVQPRGCVVEFDEALRIGADVPVDLGERWSDRLLLDLRAMKPGERSAWDDLLKLCAAANGSAPTLKWQKACEQVLTRMESRRFEEHLGRWFALVGKSRPGLAGGKVEGRDSSVPSDRGADVLRGLAFAASRFDSPRMAQALGDLAMACYKMVPGVGARCIKPGTSAIWALSQMKGAHALAQLSRVRQLVKFGTAKKVLDAALERLAAQLSLSTDELHEIAAPDFGLSSDGRIVEEAGEFTLELRIVGSGAEVRVLDHAGVLRKSIPQTVKASHADALKVLKLAAADIEKMLPAQRERIERLYHQQRTWRLEAWRSRYVDHALVGTIAGRLIWSFALDGETVEGIRLGEEIVDERGRRVELSPEHTVSLWHPIASEASRVLAWREFLEQRGIRQPFKQAHREIYAITDAELATRVYSNRFAAHIIRQNQLIPLCQARGWKHVLFLLDAGEGPILHIERAGLYAQFWVEPIGDEYYGNAGAYAYLQTDQVRFSETPGGEPVELQRIPPLVFSEVMRDVDLFVGVCSVGNNPQWQDGGPDGRYRDYWWSYSFGELGESGVGRRELLERLIPRLAIAERCRFEGKFLIVRGNIRTYKIHLGSGNILMEPNDQYLCIVPRAGASGSAGEIYLPFEGDRMLSVILSKALMLAEDDKIRDSSIVRQIGRG